MAGNMNNGGQGGGAGQSPISGTPNSSFSSLTPGGSNTPSNAFMGSYAAPGGFGSGPFSSPMQYGNTQYAKNPATQAPTSAPGATTAPTSSAPAMAYNTDTPMPSPAAMPIQQPMPTTENAPGIFQFTAAQGSGGPHSHFGWMRQFTEPNGFDPWGGGPHGRMGGPSYGWNPWGANFNMDALRGMLGEQGSQQLAQGLMGSAPPPPSAPAPVWPQQNQGGLSSIPLDGPDRYGY